MRALVLACLVAAACGESGQTPIAVPVVAHGGARSADVGGWHVELSRAQVGFGPAYFCASANADVDLCTTAIVELARAAPVDALAGETDLGELAGVTGTVHGAMYDWGVSWFLTRQAPSADDGAPGGHSLLLDGTATDGTTTVAFSAAVDAKPSDAGAPAVRAQHTERALTDGEATELTITIDASRWLAGIDFTALAAGGPTVQIVEGSPAYSALVNGMVSAAPAVFAWSP